MRNYRAAMVPVRFDKLEQPPLDGPMWPRVLGQRLADRKVGPGGVLSGLGNGVSVLHSNPGIVFPALTAASFWLGPKAKIFYLFAAFFAVVSAQQAFTRWER